MYHAQEIIKCDQQLKTFKFKDCIPDHASPGVNYRLHCAIVQIRQQVLLWETLEWKKKWANLYSMTYQKQSQI